MTGTPPLAPRRRLFALALAGSAVVLAIDQATKWLIVTVLMAPPRVIPIAPFFNLVLGFNPGVGFGFLGNLGPWGPPVLSGLMLAIVAVLFVWLWRTREAWEAAGLALVIGGALGNVMDRLRQGAVTDFLDFYVGQYRWPTFNLADVAIVLGVGLIVFGPRLAAPTKAAASRRPAPADDEITGS